MILTILYIAFTAYYAWSDHNRIHDWDKGLAFGIKVVLALIASTGFVTFAGFIIGGTGIDRAVRGFIDKKPPEDKDSWWGKFIYNKYGQLWARRLVIIELILFALISIIW